MSVLAHVFEAAGLVTVGLSLVRGQAESGKAPRMLHVEFPLGRPLGVPGDAEFQTGVLTAMFELLERTDVPVLVDYPDVLVEQGDEPATCALPPRFDPSLPAAIDELLGLRNAYDRNLEATGGRTLLGRIARPDGLTSLVETLLRIDAGETLDDVGWDDETAIAVGQDLRAYYEEAGLQLADNTGARQLLAWFYESTETGRLLLRVRDALSSDPAHKRAASYIAPLTQRSPA